MEGKLKNQDNKKSKNNGEIEQRGVPETILDTGDQMGMQQSMHGVSYDSMPTNDPNLVAITNIASELMPDPDFVPQMDLQLDQNFSWEMIGLGLEEPMPTQEAVDELYDLHRPMTGYANKTKEPRSFSISYIPLYR